MPLLASFCSCCDLQTERGLNSVNHATEGQVCFSTGETLSNDIRLALGQRADAQTQTQIQQQLETSLGRIDRDW